MEKNILEVTNENRLCARCKKPSGRYDICAQCKRDLDDERYLDDGAVYQGNECTDRKNSGEYFDSNEGDDNEPEQV